MSVDFSRITKGNICDYAFNELVISGITSEPSGEEYERAMTILESFALDSSTKTIDGGYNFEDRPALNSRAGIDGEFFKFYYTSLAIHLCPMFQKEPSMTLKNKAKAASQTVNRITANKQVNQVSYPARQPIGSGNRLYGNNCRNFYDGGLSEPVSSKVLRIGDIEDYTEDFTQFIGDNETLQSFSIEPDRGLVVSNEANALAVVSYRVSAPENNAINATGVNITANSSSGRVQKRRIIINVKE